MSDNGNTNSRSLTPKSFYFVIEPKVWKLTRCDDNQIIIYTGTNLADYVGKIVKLSDGHCYAVAKYIDKLPDNTATTNVTVISGPHNNCNGCQTVYKLTGCADVCLKLPTIYTQTDLSAYVGLVIKLTTGYCYTVSLNADNPPPETTPVTVAGGSYGTCSLCINDQCDSCNDFNMSVQMSVSSDPEIPCTDYADADCEHYNIGGGCTDANGDWTLFGITYTNFGPPNTKVRCMTGVASYDYYGLVVLSVYCSVYVSCSGGCVLKIFYGQINQRGAHCEGHGTYDCYDNFGTTVRCDGSFDCVDGVASGSKTTSLSITYTKSVSPYNTIATTQDITVTLG
jgi:hypothetical protein